MSTRRLRKHYSLLLNTCVTIRLKMPEMTPFQQSLWIFTLATGCVLFALLLIHKNYRLYPAFAFYVFLNLAQGLFLFVVYYRWAFTSEASWRIGWISQAVMLCARSL